MNWSASVTVGVKLDVLLRGILQWAKFSRSNFELSSLQILLFDTGQFLRK